MVQIHLDPPVSKGEKSFHHAISGAIAQLGERLPCTQEVGGSIPPGSTNFLVQSLEYSNEYSILCICKVFVL